MYKPRPPSTPASIPAEFVSKVDPKKPNTGLIHIYLAGPLGKGQGERAENTKIAIDQASRLHDLFPKDIIVFVPHLYNAWHEQKPRSRDFWFRLDFANLLRCQVVFRIPGESYGSDTEVALAWVHGIPVVHTEADLADELRKLRNQV